jgi:hypothetical protein
MVRRSMTPVPVIPGTPRGLLISFNVAFVAIVAAPFDLAQPPNRLCGENLCTGGGLVGFHELCLRAFKAKAGYEAIRPRVRHVEHAPLRHTCRPFVANLEELKVDLAKYRCNSSLAAQKDRSGLLEAELRKGVVEHQTMTVDQMDMDNGDHCTSSPLREFNHRGPPYKRKRVERSSPSS